MGFTVKANSEGQPGPQDFGYDHGDGANGIAAAVAPLGMKVYWRTFVYNAEVDPDRLKRAYLEFGPIDDEDRFLDNVFLQTKNGPLDFQAREPIHPMFGRMENTNQALELQVTQEYTGQSTMLAYLGPMWEEVLKTDTRRRGPRGRDRRRNRAGPRGHGDRRRGQPRQRRQPDRPPLLAGEPVRVRPPGMGLEARLRRHRRGLGPDDVDRRRARGPHDRGDDDGLVGGAGELPDAARHRAPVPVQRPLRAQAGRVLHQGRLEPRLLQPGRQRGARLRPLPDREQLHGAVLPGARASLRGHRDGAGEPDDVVPPRAVGPPHGQRAALLGRAGPALPDGRPVRDLDAGDLGPAGGRTSTPAASPRCGRSSRSTRPTRPTGGTPAWATGGRSAAGRSRSTARSRSRSRSAASDSAGSTRQPRRTRSAAAGPITKVRTARGARYRILEQAPGRAVVQVRGRSFFGPIVKNYVFEMSSR